MGLAGFPLKSAVDGNGDMMTYDFMLKLIADDGEMTMVTVGDSDSDCWLWSDAKRRSTGLSLFLSLEEIVIFLKE